MTHQDDGSFRDVRENVDGRPMVRMLGYLRPYWTWLVAGTLSAVAMHVVELVPAMVVAAAIDRVVAASGEPGILAQVGLMPTTVAATPDARLRLLGRLAAIGLGSYVVLVFVRFSTHYLFHRVAQHVQHDLRCDTYDHLQHLSIEFYHDHHTGGMLSILNSDVNRLEDFFNSELREIFRAVVMVAVVGAVMVSISPELAAIALLPMPIIAVATYRFMRWISPRYRTIREKVAVLNTTLANNLGGIDVIKSFDRYDVELDRVADGSADYRDTHVEALWYRQWFFAGMRFVIGGIFVGILWVGGNHVIQGAMTMGTFAMFFMFLKRLDGPMERVGKTANKWQKTKSSAERVFGILGHHPTVESPADGHAPDDLDGRVDFDDVSFGYDDAGDPALDGVDLTVEPGETVGLVGTSGGGKSTLLKLVSRFHDVDRGAIRIDGRDVRDYDVQALRDRIGVVEQSSFLFSGTIAENVAYGDRDRYAAVADRGFDALHPDERERIVAAAEAAGADCFVRDLPDGYDTEVGERGVKLSGGQRQRLSIARAILNDPDVMILDEATSDVDTETEERIQRNLERLCADRTALVIAHRLSTVRDADRIVVMSDGRVSEVGTHASLREADGTYAALWSAQASATAESADA